MLMGIQLLLSSGEKEPLVVIYQLFLLLMSFYHYHAMEIVPLKSYLVFVDTNMHNLVCIISELNVIIRVAINPDFAFFIVGSKYGPSISREFSKLIRS